MTLWVPTGLVPTVPETWPTADAWIYSTVRTDLPGHRSLRLGATTATVASASYSWPDLITATSAAVSAATGSVWSCAYSTTTGRVTLSGASSRPVGYVDRLGWLLGLGRDAGTTDAASTSRVSRVVPPGAIPLLAASWTSVTIEREREITRDRQRRRGGYVWGGARLWALRCTMSRWALEALASGWCLRTRVTVVGADSAAVSGANPDGAISGKVLGLDGPPAWRDRVERICDATLIVATSTT